MAHRVWMRPPIQSFSGGVGVPPPVPGFPGFYDYTDYVFLADSVTGGGQSIAGGGGGQSSQTVTLIKTWEVNQVQKCTFFVGGDLAALNAFKAPVTGTEVWIDSATFPRFFTGFITNNPEVVPVGETTDPATNAPVPLSGYFCSCQGSEILLNLNRIGFIPPFTNKTVGAIIAALGDYLVPGRFDWSSILNFGQVIPVYTTTPDQRFTDVVSDLIANQATKLWFVRYKAFIAFYDEQNPAVEINVNETDPQYNPFDLTIKPIQSAIVNDVTGIGDTEAQTYCIEYTLGDGITTNYPLRLPVYGTIGKPFLEDDFTGTSFDTTIWAPFGNLVEQSQDPSNAFVFDSGRLNVVGGVGLNATKLLAAQGVEIKGQLNVNAGEFQFIDTCDAIVGGLFTSQNLTLDQCVFGWRITGGGSTATGQIVNEAPEGSTNGSNTDFFLSQFPSGPVTITVTATDGTVTHPVQGTDFSIQANDAVFVSPPPNGSSVRANYAYVIGGGAGISIQPIVNGQLVGVPVITKPSMTYSMHIQINTPISKTTLPPWYSTGSAFGGGSRNAPVSVSFLVEEYSQLAIRDPNKFTPYNTTVVAVPAFLFIGELSVNNANMVINYFSVDIPIQGTLITQLDSDETPSTRVLGFVGENYADATITDTQESEALAFFKQTRPVARQRNQFIYRSAGPAIARIIDSNSIALERLRYRDSGVRSALLTNLTPLPPSAEELEWALQAYLDDHTAQQFEGSWTAMLPPESFITEPAPGRFINVNCPSRTPEVGQFSELVKVVTVNVLTETDHSIDGQVTLIPGSTTIPTITDFGNGPPNIVNKAAFFSTEPSAPSIDMGTTTPGNLLIGAVRWRNFNPTTIPGFAGTLPTISDGANSWASVFEDPVKGVWYAPNSIASSGELDFTSNAGVDFPFEGTAFFMEVENAASVTFGINKGNSSTILAQNGDFSFELPTSTTGAWLTVLAVVTAPDGETLGIAIVLSDGGFGIGSIPPSGWNLEFTTAQNGAPGNTDITSNGQANVFTKLGPAPSTGSPPDGEFIVAGSGEIFEIQFDFGLVVTREMQQVLARFEKPDPPSVATLRQVSQVPTIDTTQVGIQYIEDITNLTLVDRDASYLYFDIGKNIPTGEQIEVRYSDASWGQIAGSNFIGRFSTRTFAIARKHRDTLIFAKLAQTNLATTNPFVPRNPQPVGPEPVINGG